ncbi:MAG: glycosyltransferase family 2 protein [Methylomonas sp.]
MMMEERAPDDLWVVIPAFNEGSVIADVLAETKRFCRNVVLVDDGSSDDTAEHAQKAGAIVLRHPINLGQGAALQTGIEFALKNRANFIATYDADGQHDVRDIPPMVRLLRDGKLDVVLGSRFIGKTYGMTIARRLLLQAAVLFTRVTTGLKVTDAHNGLRVFTRQGAMNIALSQNRMAHASEILEQIARNRLAYTEFGNMVRYTEYSRAKGQKASNAINIVIDLAIGRMSK